MRTLLIFSVAIFAICAETVADGESDALRAVAHGAIEFSDDFLKVVTNETIGNLISSPFSAQVVLAMAAYGADGTTASQMRSVLHMPAGDDEFSLSGYRSLMETLNDVKGVELGLANKVYIMSGFAVKSAYKQLTADKFFSESQEVDFNNAIAAASFINSWCEAQTNNHVKDVITADSFNADTRLVLVNAVYFKGMWAEKFDPALTTNKNFDLNAQTSKLVPTMSTIHKFRWGNLPEINARFIELPYQDNEVSMIIILPNNVEGLKRVLDNFHQVNLTENLQRSYFSNVSLHLPKFRIETTLDLEVTLKKMGMTDMFENAASFLGIAAAPLKVSKVVQKAFIEVNEEGSEAAAATGVVIETRSGGGRGLEPEVPFEVDRPALYVIRHTATGTTLFSGLLIDP